LHTRKIVKLDASHAFDFQAIIVGFTSWELNLGNNSLTILDVINFAKHQMAPTVELLLEAREMRN
jgi:hypothetical protein